MKSLGFIFSFLSTPVSRRNTRLMAYLLGALVVVVAIYSTIFHALMEREGQSHSWPTAVYWTLVTMSTLGFGDITFQSDAGRIFSVVVLLSGAVFILVLLPFAFIQFVFVPWMEARQRARAPRELPEDLRDHVLLTGIGPIEAALITRLDRAGIPYASIIDDLDEALRFHDDGYAVMVGAQDDPATFGAARVEAAAMVIATANDPANTNIVFTVQEISEETAIVATANSSASVDILQLAGCDHVLQLGDMLGRALAARVLGPDARATVIGEFGELLIAEATAPDDLAGKPLSESGLRVRTGLSVAGVWERGELVVARPTTVLQEQSILVLAGSREQLDSYDDQFSSPAAFPQAPVIIIGGGRVGRAAAKALVEAGLDYRIIEQRPERVRDPEKYVVGDAADLSVLQDAGIDRTPTVMVTTHDDDINIYLTIYCRRLRPDIQIIARARLDRNVSTLHRAGADSVLSYASTGANAIWNLLSEDNTVQLAEGLDVFRIPVPDRLRGRTLEKSGIRDATGCTVVAIVENDHFESNPRPDTVLPAAADLILIGDAESEHRFLSRYSPKPES